ncbi:hypothetical protein CRENBAI_002866, partial [Crenichthys baileyi]
MQDTVSSSSLLLVRSTENLTLISVSTPAKPGLMKSISEGLNTMPSWKDISNDLREAAVAADQPGKVHKVISKPSSPSSPSSYREEDSSQEEN